MLHAGHLERSLSPGLRMTALQNIGIWDKCQLCGGWFRRVGFLLMLCASPGSFFDTVQRLGVRLEMWHHPP